MSQTPPVAFILPASTRDQILERLIRQPYADVHALITLLRALPVAPATTPPPLAGCERLAGTGGVAGT